MNLFSYLIFASVFLYCCGETTGQGKTYSPANGHAHNDYLNTHPFYDAYKSGFGSIEVDVFPIDGKLLVAHTKNEIEPVNSLMDMYIRPLQQELATGNARNIRLLIDIKENHKVSLDLLQKELEPLLPFLNSAEKNNPVTIIISGERPLPAAYKNYPAYIFFDSDLRQMHSSEEWERVALISLAFNKISDWKGEMEPVDDQLQAVKRVIDSAHQSGKPIRFWAAPDTKLSWKWQKELKVDLIGTDKINELCTFLKKEGD